MRFDRGSIRFIAEHNDLEPSEPRQDIFVFDCHPTPGGSSRQFPLPDDFLDDVFDRGFLQANELERIVQGAREANEANLSNEDLLAKIIGGIKQQFDKDRLGSIDLGNIPAKWKTIQPCVTKTISVQICYNIFDIKAQVKEDIALGGEKYPKGDVVATFRYAIPAFYFFTLLIEGNPKCCEKGDVPRAPVQDKTHYFPRPLQLGRGVKGVKEVDPRAIEELRFEPNRIRRRRPR